MEACLSCSASNFGTSMKDRATRFSYCMYVCMYAMCDPICKNPNNYAFCILRNTNFTQRMDAKAIV